MAVNTLPDNMFHDRRRQTCEPQILLGPGEIYAWLMALPHPDTAFINICNISSNYNTGRNIEVRKRDKIKEIVRYVRNYEEQIVPLEEAQDEESIVIDEDYYVEAPAFDWGEALEFHSRIEKLRQCRHPQDYRK